MDNSTNTEPTAPTVEPTTTTTAESESTSIQLDKPLSLDDLYESEAPGDPEQKTAEPDGVNVIGLDNDEDTEITLVSGDGVEYKVLTNVAKLSGLINTAIEGDTNATHVPLPNVKGDILMMVVDYLKEIYVNPPEEIEKPIKSKIMTEIVDGKSAAFVEVSQDILFELLLTANYMDIKPLLDLICAKIGSMITGSSVEEIRAKFNIVNDFTPEEEAAVREENKWAEES
jgi:S-phase kinase-associated protein 1